MMISHDVGYLMLNTQIVNLKHYKQRFSTPLRGIYIIHILLTFNKTRVNEDES